MTNIAGCIMRTDKRCGPLAIVFARRAGVRIGVSADFGSMANAELGVEEAKAFRRALSRAIREAEAYVPPKEEEIETVRETS